MAGAETVRDQKVRALDRVATQRGFLQRGKESRAIGNVLVHFCALEDGEHTTIQAAMNVFARTPAAPEHHRQLRGLLIPRNHGNGGVRIARLDPLQARAHAEDPYVAAQTQPRLDLLFADGPGCIFERLLRLGLNLCQIRPQAARLNRFGNLGIGAPVPRLRHRHTIGRNENRIVAPHVVQEKRKRILLGLHRHERALGVRQRIGSVHGEFDPARIRAGEGPAGGDITLPRPGNHPPPDHDAALGAALLPNHSNRPRS